MVFPRAGTLVPGGLGQQILKTMLRRYEALGVSVVLPLSKRVASLLSMVFCAKATNPQELVDIEMETKLRTCAVPGQARRGGRCGGASAVWLVGEAERHPPGGERRQAKG